MTNNEAKTLDDVKRLSQLSDASLVFMHKYDSIRIDTFRNTNLSNLLKIEICIIQRTRVITIHYIDDTPCMCLSDI